MQVGGRTVVSALVALGILKLADRNGWGLLGKPVAGLGFRV